jgi:DNA invertase Pin-like site-specific DNA recombinase
MALGARLREREIDLHVIEHGIDITAVEDPGAFGMPSVFAEPYRELVVAHAMDGFASASGRAGGDSESRRRPGCNRSTAPSRAGEDHPADRQHVRRVEADGSRAPGWEQDPSSLAREDRGRGTLADRWRWLRAATGGRPKGQSEQALPRIQGRFSIGRRTASVADQRCALP